MGRVQEIAKTNLSLYILCRGEPTIHTTSSRGPSCNHPKKEGKLRCEIFNKIRMSKKLETFKTNFASCAENKNTGIQGMQRLPDPTSNAFIITRQWNSNHPSASLWFKFVFRRIFTLKTKFVHRWIPPSSSFKQKYWKIKNNNKK